MEIWQSRNMPNITAVQPCLCLSGQPWQTNHGPCMVSRSEILQWALMRVNT